jgi:uncharacterized repeat protein (TIGR01451 family)
MRRRPFGPARPGTRARRKSYRVSVEVMEARCLLASFTVTNTGDGGPGSLRQAILDSNASGNPSNTINFNIPGTGVQTITPQSPLPTITVPVTIDGTTEAAAQPPPPTPISTPLIEISGGAVAAGTNGLTITAGNSLIKDLAIDRFAGGAAIAISGAGTDTLSGNFLGINPAGTAAAPNAIGVRITGVGNNTIGGNTSADRNLISGNTTAGVIIEGAGATGNIVLANWIGLDVTGNLPVGNAAGIIVRGDGTPNSAARNNTIGGVITSARNVISGNGGIGVEIRDAGATGSNNSNLVEGNFIGTNASGTAVVGNAVGVQIDSGAAGNTVGGLSTGARNVISGNGAAGVEILASNSNVVQGNFIGTNADGSAALAAPATAAVGVLLDNGATSNAIGGTQANAPNVISGNSGDGVVISGSSIAGGTLSASNVVQGNFIGTTLAGNKAIANAGSGVVLRAGANKNTIGGAAAGNQNIISGNALSGIVLIDATTTDNLIQGNLIGAAAGGTTALANGGDGILVDGALRTTIGAANGTTAGTPASNTIAFNKAFGVEVASGTGNSIRVNSIFGNTKFGIGLDDNANNQQPPPGLLTAQTSSNTTTVTGQLHAQPNASYTIDIYADDPTDAPGVGQGRTYAGTTTVTTDANGNATFTLPVLASQFPSGVPNGGFVTGTATDASGNTSAFSLPVTAGAATADVGLTMTASPVSAVGSGGLITYTIGVTNAGPSSASNVAVSDPLPAGVVFDSATASQGSVTASAAGSTGGQTITANLGSVASGQGATITIVVTAPSTVPTPPTLTNTATVTATESDNNTKNNTATVVTNVVASADLAVTVTATPNPATTGGTIGYLFTVTNNGPAAATGVILSSVLPTAGATFQTASIAAPNSAPGNFLVNGQGIFGAAIGNLASGASAQVAVILKPTTTGAVGLAAAAIGNEPDIFPGNNVAFLAVPVNAPSPATADGPQVTDLTRSGSGRQPTTLVLTFNEALDPTRANDIGNYVVTLPGQGNARVALQSATYNPSNNTVTLVTKRPIGVNTPIRLRVNGTTSSGLTDTAGRSLDGARTGRPGSDYVVTFRGLGSGPNGPNGAVVTTAAVARPVRLPLDTRILNHIARTNPPAGKSQRTQP